MVQIFTAIFYQPILNLLVFVYNVVPGNDIGIAIIVMTVIIKMILFPLSKKSIESQKALQDIQPKVEKIKKEYANDKAEMNKKMMEVYANNKVNPLSSCLPLLIQLPFLIAVYKVFRVGLSNGSLDLVYSFVHKPELINAVSFGFLDLSKPNIVLAVLAGLAQFWQARMMTRKKALVKGDGSRDEDMTATINKQMLYFMPILTVFIGFSLPGGLTLYWFVTTLLTSVQQVFVFKSLEKKGAEISSNTGAETKVVEGEIVENKAEISQ